MTREVVYFLTLGFSTVVGAGLAIREVLDLEGVRMDLRDLRPGVNMAGREGRGS